MRVRVSVDEGIMDQVMRVRASADEGRVLAGLSAGKTHPSPFFPRSLYVFLRVCRYLCLHLQAYVSWYATMSPLEGFWSLPLASGLASPMSAMCVLPATA